MANVFQIGERRLQASKGTEKVVRDSSGLEIPFEFKEQLKEQLQELEELARLSLELALEYQSEAAELHARLQTYEHLAQALGSLATEHREADRARETSNSGADRGAFRSLTRYERIRSEADIGDDGDEVRRSSEDPSGSIGMDGADETDEVNKPLDGGSPELPDAESSTAPSTTQTPGSQRKKVTRTIDKELFDEVTKDAAEDVRLLVRRHILGEDDCLPIPEIQRATDGMPLLPELEKVERVTELAMSYYRKRARKVSGTND